MLSCGKFKFNYKYFVYNLEHMLGLILVSINIRDCFKVQQTDCRVQIFQPYNYTRGGGVCKNEIISLPRSINVKR